MVWDSMFRKTKGILTVQITVPLLEEGDRVGAGRHVEASGVWGGVRCLPRVYTGCFKTMVSMSVCSYWVHFAVPVLPFTVLGDRFYYFLLLIYFLFNLKLPNIQCSPGLRSRTQGLLIPACVLLSAHRPLCPSPIEPLPPPSTLPATLSLFLCLRAS